MLSRTLLDGINRSMHSSYRLTSDACQHLQTYRYPGNVRELRNILFIAATRSLNRTIDAALIDSVIHNLPNCINAAEPAVTEAVQVARVAPKTAGESEQVTLKDLEAKHISELLDQYQGNRKKAADALGISERTIYRKLKELGIT